MPFGLTNAPSVFQRLMQRVLQGLNPDDGPDFVSVYIDDVLVFSRNLSDHLKHLRLVIQRIQGAGLKLKPLKCHFIRTEVEYLGHVITPQGLKTNPKIVIAVTEFPVPRTVRETRKFLGLCSYYRRFIPHFARVARPLHNLTKKNVEFQWTNDFQHSADVLKQKLTSAPVLAYPCFRRKLILETDASICGIGARVDSLAAEQCQDPEIVEYVAKGTLPADPNRVRKIVLLSPQFSQIDDALFLVDTSGRRNWRVRAAVPRHLRTQLMEEHHRGPLGSHFSGERLFSTLSRCWWWEAMHRDTVQFVRNCPECAIVRGGGRVYRPPLHPIPVRRPFQILGVDIMDLPVTQLGNRHVVVFQDYLTKWPMVFPVPDQRAHRLARLIAEEIVPMFGVPEGLLSDRGANLLSVVRDQEVKHDLISPPM